MSDTKCHRVKLQHPWYGQSSKETPNDMSKALEVLSWRDAQLDSSE